MSWNDAPTTFEFTVLLPLSLPAIPLSGPGTSGDSYPGPAEALGLNPTFDPSWKVPWRP